MTPNSNGYIELAMLLESSRNRLLKLDFQIEEMIWSRENYKVAEFSCSIESPYLFDRTAFVNPILRSEAAQKFSHSEKMEISKSSPES